MSTETVLLFQELIKNGINATNHTSKMIAFSKLLENVYNVKIQDLLPGIEKKIGSRILGLRGSIDLLFSYLVLEFKTDFISSHTAKIRKSIVDFSKMLNSFKVHQLTRKKR